MMRIRTILQARRALLGLGAAGMVGILLTVGLAGSARADGGGTVDLVLRLGTDGVVSVTEQIHTDGSNISGVVPGAMAVEGNRTQHLEFSDVSVAGSGSASVDDGDLKFTVSGDATITYSVRGTVADGPVEGNGQAVQQFTFPLIGALSQDVDTVTAQLVAPSDVDSPVCAYGQLGLRRLCTSTQAIEGTVSATQAGLAAGQTMLFTTLLPDASVAATASFTATTPMNAPDDESGAAELIAVGIAVLLALLAVGWAYRQSRAVAVARARTAPQPALVDAAGSFSAPGGVSPGQVGILAAARVDASDLGATIADLAARDHLWIGEVAGPSGVEWQISRRGEGAGLGAYERAVIDAIVPKDQHLFVSELVWAADAPDVSAARIELFGSARSAGWIRRRPDTASSPGLRIGIGLVGIGAIIAIALAVAGASALYGVALAIVGLGVIVADRVLPVLTPAGAERASQIAALRRVLEAPDLSRYPAEHRAAALSGAVGYAHATGTLAPFLAGALPQLDPAGIDWYAPLGDGPFDAAAFAQNLPKLLGLLDGVATRAFRAADAPSIIR